MPSECTFELNKGNATYFCGETIQGIVTLITTNEKNVKGISIIFLGEAKVRWQEVAETDNIISTAINSYSSHEIFINDNTNLHGEGVLPSGTYQYNIHIPLPVDCPTSCEGKYGHIRYEISLKISRDGQYDNVFKKPVTIIKPLDLNLNPGHKRPIIVDNTISTCWLPCMKSNVYCTIEIPYGAYAPGQTLRYTLEVNNQSKEDIEGYCVNFKKKLTFYAKHPRNKRCHTKTLLVPRSIAETDTRRGTRIIDGEFLIPATPPTTGKSKNIIVEYYLKISVYLLGCGNDLELKVPITIGTVPIKESIYGDHLLNSDEQAEGQTENILRPTFEEESRCSTPFIDTDIDAINCIVGFQPLYTMYRINSSEQS